MDTDKRARVANMLRMDELRERQLHENAAGLLNSLKNSEWLSVAEELANLSPDDFQKIMYTFHLYRDAKLMDKHREEDPGAALPERKSAGKEELPGIDEVFEKYLSDSTSGKIDAEKIKGVSRRIYYGSHYPRLFPSLEERPPGAFKVVRAAAFDIPDEAIEEGERLADHFVSQHPERVQGIYRPR